MHAVAVFSALSGLCGFVSARLPITTTNDGGNILPTQFPVSMFPVTTQTHFDSPTCTQGPSPQQGFTVNYNFETVERGVPTTALTQIKVYNLLNFLNINYVNTDPDFDGNHLGLAPYTYPSAATFNAGTQLLDLFTPGAATITANYTESTLDSFTPHSFYYGCVAPSPYTAGSLPVSCAITATGFDAAGRKIASQVFDFKANGSIIQNQNYGKFGKGFANVYSVNFGLSDPVVAAALVDNFIATVYQKACSPFYEGSYNLGK